MMAKEKPAIMAGFCDWRRSRGILADACVPGFLASPAPWIRTSFPSSASGTTRAPWAESSSMIQARNDPCAARPCARKITQAGCQVGRRDAFKPDQGLGVGSSMPFRALCETPFT